MDLKLSDKVALVSGSTSGIGLAILLQRGYANDHIKHSVPNAELQGIAADLETIAGVELLLRHVPEVNCSIDSSCWRSSCRVC
jgi:NAD(P)-dependent dehydrogenase (short-subunit alcohol dehydrogenase family)